MSQRAPLPPFDAERVRASLAWYRARPSVTAAAHEHARRVALGHEVLQRQRVYLDQCYWLRLREAMLGRTQDPALVALLALLRNSVHEGRRMCPISQATFFELFKQ